MTDKDKKITRDLYRLWDRYHVSKNKDIAGAVEHLTVNVLDGESNELPEAIEYTCCSGSVADTLTKNNDVSCAVLSDSVETCDWLLSGEDREERQKLVFFDDPISLERPGFVVSPTGGWKLVVLRDILSYLENDDHLTELLRIIKDTMVVDGTLVMSVNEIIPGVRVKDIGGVTFTEKTEKNRPRVFTRVFMAKVDKEGYRSDEKVLSWGVADLHACAKNAGFKPVSSSGLNPLVFCTYQKI